MGLLFKPHPWHGLPIGKDVPNKVTVYIEIVPTDTVKYEIDKETGYLKVDRPQRFSNVSPSMYGLIPQTFCAESVAEYCCEKTGREGIKGDGDPLDICVLAEKSLTMGGVILEAIPIGGLRMLDGDEADDKIIAVMRDDAVFGQLKDISECPESLVERLRHYFLTYKDIPGSAKAKTEITHIYGREEAHEVIRRSRLDYEMRFKGLDDLLVELIKKK
ncbi:MAG: inorganic pyrophosphatase [Ignavibacteriaceae bacterium]|nr:MAG: inorganic pyrophosphatase [Ignavibacteriaceae bacterium]MBW7871825.1 inorganic pyrophosphatase [Ignavibacteria bacterium]